MHHPTEPEEQRGQGRADGALAPVQAAIIPLGQTEIWAVQYHPEYDLRQVLAIYALYAEDGVVKALHLEESPGTCDISGGEALLKAI